MGFFSNSDKGLVWEELKTTGLPFGQNKIFRCSVPGGWLVLQASGTMTFVPDSQHEWNGDSPK